jgi:hypothetical protein
MPILTIHVAELVQWLCPKKRGKLEMFGNRIHGNSQGLRETVNSVLRG